MRRLFVIMVFAYASWTGRFVSLVRGQQHNLRRHQQRPSQGGASAAAAAAAAQQQWKKHNTKALLSSLASLVGKQRDYHHTLRHSTTRESSSYPKRQNGTTTTTDNNDNDDNNNKQHFDLLVIGAGSGGIAAARRAASYGASVAVIEGSRLGGTCVNVGCVPKKVLWHASSIAETIHDMSHYGFQGEDDIAFDWQALKRARDAYIRRLNGIYQRNLETSQVQILSGMASFLAPDTVQVVSNNNTTATQVITANHILIAVGGKPTMPSEPGIAEYAISSDGFFDELQELPRRAVVVGAGYIAVELAGVLQALGTDTHLVVRKEMALRSFDALLRDTLDAEMQRQGIEIYRHTNGVERIVLEDDDVDSSLKTVYLKNGQIIHGVDTVLMAPGREPHVEPLQLQNAGVKQQQQQHRNRNNNNDNSNNNNNSKNGGYIVTNEYSETNVPNIYAVGDVVGRAELTPMAIAAGRRLADRLFGNNHPQAKVSYDLVPTVVFSHPTIGTIGLTEEEAVEKYGADNIRVYQSKFANLYYGPWQVDADDKPKTAMKLVCAGSNELIVGLHVIGRGADEMLQGFGVALKMGATKADFDATVAIHPTAAEEFVTMYPWGLGPQVSGAKHSPLNGADPPEPAEL